MRPRRRRTPKTFLISAVLVATLLLGFLGVMLFSVHANVTVTEKARSVTIDGSFIGKYDAKEGDLPFETISATKEETVTVPSTGEKQVETRASGTIIIYNTYSTASQRLIKNTRFETPDGRIYRIDESVTVPGQSKDGKKPGSIEAVVYADAAGKDYNIGLSDFTIPGFKGDPRYSKFYARSKTPMTGGFIGSIKTASALDLKTARENLEQKLKGELATELSSKIPAGYVLFPNATYFVFEQVSPPDSNEVDVKATSYGVIFNAKTLASHIAEKTVADYKAGDVVEAENLSSLLFTPIPADVKPWETGIVSFSLSGATTLVWHFDQEKLKVDLAGQMKDKARIAEILGAYPSIENAEVVVRPLWRKNLPEDVADITVKIAPRE